MHFNQSYLITEILFPEKSILEESSDLFKVGVYKYFFFAAKQF